MKGKQIIPTFKISLEIKINFPEHQAAKFQGLTLLVMLFAINSFILLTRLSMEPCVSDSSALFATEALLSDTFPDEGPSLIAKVKKSTRRNAKTRRRPWVTCQFSHRAIWHYSSVSIDRRFFIDTFIVFFRSYRFALIISRQQSENCCFTYPNRKIT